MSYIYNCTSYANLTDAQLACVADYMTAGGNDSDQEIREYVCQDIATIVADMRTDGWRVLGDPNDEELGSLVADIKDSYL